MSIFRNIVFFILVIFIMTAFPPVTFSQEKAKEAGKTNPIDTDHALPTELSLCGEPMPLGNPWVFEMLDREMTISVWNKEQVFMWLKRAGRYFPYVEEALAKEKMPEDIKYLAIAESGLLPKIKSYMGATGVWQFMEGTADRHGLRTDDRMDERRDFEASTAAALKYLRNLKAQFGSWTLAMAAYNCGEKRVASSLKEQRQVDYYNLKLPEETERYIYRIAAVKLIMENPERYGYRVPAENVYKPVSCDSAQVTIKKNIRIVDFAESLGVTYKLIRDMNPKITDSYFPTGSYLLRVPVGKGALVPSVIKTLSGKSAPRVETAGGTYVVKPGDTLSGISKKTGVSVSRLKTLNSIKGEVIKVGQVLSLD